MQRVQFDRSLLLPRYWGLWCITGLWWLSVNMLPYAALMSLGKGMGRAAKKFSPRRRKIAEKNIALCFPSKTQSEQNELVKACFEATGRAVFESGMAWFWPRWRFKLNEHRFVVEGMEHLLQAQKEGGVLLFSMHFTTLELTAALVSQRTSIDGMYRAHSNRVYEFVQRKGRERHNKEGVAIERSNLRGLIKRLKAKRTVSYLPDQDYGKRVSVFVPFFNIPTATVTATADLAKMTGASVIPISATWNGETGIYHVFIAPKFENFPSKGKDSKIRDAHYVSQFVESAIKCNPEQYLWVHRRFKTRPDEQKDFYDVEKFIDKDAQRKRRKS